jgi:uncharacterized protein YceK
MGIRRLSLALLTLAALAGCGSAQQRTLSIQQLPLVDGASVVAQTTQCDRGANGFCAIEAVIVDRRFGSSGALVASEGRMLHSLGWTTSAGDDGPEVAAQSPGQKLRVTYATAKADLIGRDEGWIKRSRSIALALDRQFIHGIPAMSILLEVGAT